MISHLFEYTLNCSQLFVLHIFWLIKYFNLIKIIFVFSVTFWWQKQILPPPTPFPSLLDCCSKTSGTTHRSFPTDLGNNTQRKAVKIFDFGNVCLNQKGAHFFKHLFFYPWNLNLGNSDGFCDFRLCFIHKISHHYNLAFTGL